MKKLNVTELSVLFTALDGTAKLYIPADTENGAEFVRYADGITLTKKLNTQKSPKDFFFPQSEDLMKFRVAGKKIEVIDTRSEHEDFVLFGVRACDVRALTVLDHVFLSDPVDTYYKNRREHGVIVSLACNRPE